MSLNIRERQIAALKHMLNLNVPLKGKANEPVWKVLIYDRSGQDIISPLLSVRDLRDLGVPAVYFVAPTQENISRIGQDLRNELYDQYYLNFISPLSRQFLEDLASAAISANCVQSVSKVFDQYLNFITVDNDMFLLKQHGREAVSYYALNRGSVSDAEMDSVINSIVDCLFSVFATLGTVPIIRAPKGNAAEMVAERLDKKLKDNLRDTRNSLFLDMTPGQFSFQRPLLVILDRNMDMATPLHHTWTYQALTHDVLDYKLNRVTLEEAVGPPDLLTGAKPRTKSRTYDLSVNDKFWQQHKGSPFPTVAEAVQEELEKYRASEEEVKRLKAQMGLDGDNADEAMGLLNDNTAKLTYAVSSLPELLEKKRLIDQHTTIATSILDEIKLRKLDTYFEIEEKILGRQTLERSIQDTLADPLAGSPNDKLRLFLINFICNQIPPEELKEYEGLLEKAGCDLKPVKYLKRWKDFSQMQVQAQQAYAGSGTKTVGMFSKLMSQGSQFVMEGVKNLVVKKHKLPLARIVESLMDLKSGPETDDFRYFDPKLLRGISSEFGASRTQTLFSDAIVFVVGGGNYIEYQNLIECMRTKSTPRNVVYGCTELMNARQFVQQLASLGEEIN
ncbi:sec1 family domain-containing protein 1-like [Tropilaelaps mercedesae]|uniref:Sec1 family domain-containing protein 1-like n=1 Tax=Tropilaelaps mercedesae TaxID=418985 RepID=A0A1V9Y113_9ACAR|nr:sec1 family domain-containing protein 1-like [Tropilaelaps mercedesae]